MPSIQSNLVEVCVFKFEHDRPWYLLLRRTHGERLYPNIWQFISGTVEAGEKSVDAALRELREETSLDPRAFWNVPFVNSFYDHTSDVINLSPLFAAQVDGGSIPKLSPEHATYEWFSFDEALRKLVWPGQRLGLRVVHEYVVGGQEAAQFTRVF